MIRETLSVILLSTALAGCGAASSQGQARAALEAQTREARCKGGLGGVRAVISDFYADRAILDNAARWPTLEELTKQGMIHGGTIPPNPYNNDGRVAKATMADAEARRIVGSGEGWAYFEGEGVRHPACFYGNTSTQGVSENTW